MGGLASPHNALMLHERVVSSCGPPSRPSTSASESSRAPTGEGSVSGYPVTHRNGNRLLCGLSSLSSWPRRVDLRGAVGCDGRAAAGGCRAGAAAAWRKVLTGGARLERGICTARLLASARCDRCSFCLGRWFGIRESVCQWQYRARETNLFARRSVSPPELPALSLVGVVNYLVVAARVMAGATRNRTLKHA
jgi:hypothetical protein